MHLQADLNFNCNKLRSVHCGCCTGSVGLLSFGVASAYRILRAEPISCLAARELYLLKLSK